MDLYGFEGATDFHDLPGDHCANLDPVSIFTGLASLITGVVGAASASKGAGKYEDLADKAEKNRDRMMDVVSNMGGSDFEPMYEGADALGGPKAGVPKTPGVGTQVPLGQTPPGAVSLGAQPGTARIGSLASPLWKRG